MRRGEFLLDLASSGWAGELEAMNDGKEGKPFRYPERLIKMLAFIHVFFHLPYRQTEGFMNALRRYDGALKTPDYSTIDRRTNKLKIDVDPKLDGAKPVTIAVDSSGIKVSNSGDWTREKWGADKNRKILSEGASRSGYKDEEDSRYGRDEGACT